MYKKSLIREIPNLPDSDRTFNLGSMMKAISQALISILNWIQTTSEVVQMLIAVHAIFQGAFDNTTTSLWGQKVPLCPPNATISPYAPSSKQPWTIAPRHHTFAPASLSCLGRGPVHAGTRVTICSVLVRPICQHSTRISRSPA